jgi:hypothetical protein
MLARLTIVAAVTTALLAAPAQAAPPPEPSADGIIAVLIGIKQPLTAPHGSTVIRGSEE